MIVPSILLVLAAICLAMTTQKNRSFSKIFFIQITLQNRAFLVIVTSLLFFSIELSLFDNHQKTMLESFFRKPPTYLLDTDRDQVRMYFEIHKLLNVDIDDDTHVYILGGSTAREFFGSPEALQGDNPDLRFYNLATPLQNIADSMRIMDNINPDNAVVIYMLNPLKLFRSLPRNLLNSYYTNKIPLSSKETEAVLEENLKRYKLNLKEGYGPYKIYRPLNLYTLLYNRHYEALNRNITHDIPLQWEPENILYHENRYLDYDSKQCRYLRKIISRRLLKVLPKGRHIEKTLHFNLQLLGEMINLAKKKNIQLVILELPISETLEKKFHRYYPLYREKITEFQNSMTNLNFAQLPEEENTMDNGQYFCDYLHATTAGREFFRPYIVELVNKYR